jgi:hypothetical protein
MTKHNKKQSYGGSKARQSNMKKRKTKKSKKKATSDDGLRRVVQMKNGNLHVMARAASDRDAAARHQNRTDRYKQRLQLRRERAR